MDIWEMRKSGYKERLQTDWAISGIHGATVQTPRKEIVDALEFCNRMREKSHALILIDKRSIEHGFVKSQSYSKKTNKTPNNAFMWGREAKAKKSFI